jgi:Rab GDP dissociation inhibitor
MDEEYDVIVLGTGLKESILSGLMSSVAKKKVLHMDRNPYYGGESASLNLDQLYKKFRNGATPPESLGKSREYCIDLCPKFLMACGDLVKVLLQTQVTLYLEFQSVAGSFVYKDNKLHQVPSTAPQALASSLMGMFQKRRFKNFITWVNNYEPDDAKTHSGLDLKVKTSAEVYDYWKLEEATKIFTGHAVCLFIDDSYLTRPALEMVERAKLYAYSVSRYGNSPYIYPKWGLGMLPEGFSRRCAVFGGIYMLNVEEKKDFVEKVVFDEAGKAIGVQSEGKIAKCKQVIADPSYFLDTDKIKSNGQVARCICILSHPIDMTNNVDGCQVIFPASSVGRKSDIYVSMVSYVHNVAPQGKYIAVVSTNVETKEPEKELDVALKFLGKIDEKFFWVTNCYLPANNSEEDNCFITESYDATSHFTTSTKEVLKMYKALTGTEVDLSGSAEPSDLEQ